MSAGMTPRCSPGRGVRAFNGYDTSGFGPMAPEYGQAPAKKPNILIIWGDDIGVHNVSAYNHGIMGYRTPTSTASPEKVRSSPTLTGSSRARPAARPSCWGSTLKAASALKRLHELETLSSPHN